MSLLAPGFLRSLLLGSLTVSLLACPPPAEDAECDLAVGSDHFRFDPQGSSMAPPPDAAPTPGTFSSWGEGEILFDRKGGPPYGFSLVLEGQATLPDVLGDTSPLHPSLTVFGFNPPAGSPSEPALRFGGDPGNPRLLAGNVELLEPVDGWTVRSPRDIDTCRVFQRDNGLGRFKPVYIGRDGQEERLFAGQGAVFDDFEVFVVSAQSNNRDHPWAPCSSDDCPWEKLAWWIAPLDSELLPPLE